MARNNKAKKKQPANEVTPSMEATLKKIHSQLTDPTMWGQIYSGAKGVRKKLLRMDYNTLRSVVDKVPLIGGVINTRADQILPFCDFTMERGRPGYTFELTDRSGQDKWDEQEAYALADFLDQTGFIYDPEREDDFQDYVQMLVRETLTIDQIATEVQSNRKGEAAAFWLLDGATIYRVSEESEFSKGIRYVQQVEEQIYNKYTHEQLIFDYKYKRADIRYRGYGYAPVEQAIDIITTLLFGYNYLKDQFVKDKVPKGFISVMGDVDQEQMDALRNYWYSAMQGAGGKWNIPILPSGKDGVGVEFKPLNTTNKDMEYHKLMMFVSTIIGAVFSIDLAEMGIKTDDSQQMIGENTQPRLQHSKDRGLESLLMFIQQHVNKILRKVTTKYKFRFVGIRPEDEQHKAEVETKQLQSSHTIDEIRQQRGLDPLNTDYSGEVLNAQTVQLIMNEKQQEQQQQMMQQQAGGEEEEEGGGEGQPDIFSQLSGGGGDNEEESSEEGSQAGQEENNSGGSEKGEVQKSLREKTDEIERSPVKIIIE